MPEEPPVKRAVAFYDGQNLYRHAKEAFGHHHPNYDPIKLFDAVCDASQWQNHGVRFYTGTPAVGKNPMWHGYWANRLLAMRRAGIFVTSRPIRYREETIELPDGTFKTVEIGREKGIDLRIGLDVVRMARNNQLDVAVIFSQDQDLAEVVSDVREISQTDQRWLKVVSAFPSGRNATTNRGINNTDWFEMDQDFYDACLDPRDYRPRKSK
jgi:uncharacterized LabA/DUF88 family protein